MDSTVSSSSEASFYLVPEKPTSNLPTVSIVEDEFGVSSTTPPLPRPPKSHPLTPMVSALIAAKCEAEAKEG